MPAARSNLVVVFAEVLAAGVLIVKGAKMFGSAFGGGGANPAGQVVEELGQAVHGSPSGAPPIGGNPLRSAWLGAEELARAAPGYVWGGGHGSNALQGADCSGAVSYVLDRAGLLQGTLTSGQFESYGDAGAGQHVTIYANPQHVLMEIDGHFFGTSGFGHPNAPNQTGANWFSVKPSQAYLSQFTPRHPPGL